MGVKTLWTQDALDLRHFGISAEVYVSVHAKVDVCGCVIT